MEELTKQTQTRNDKMQLMMEQIVLSNKSSQKEKTEAELTAEFGANGWKRLPDAISRCYRFVPEKSKLRNIIFWRSEDRRVLGTLQAQVP